MPDREPCITRDDVMCATMGRRFGRTKFYCRACKDWTIWPGLHNRLMHSGRLEVHHACG